MEEHEKTSGKKTENILILLLILIILVFLVLNYFNHPPHEDFYYADQTKNLGFSKAFRSLYKFYGGRYFTYVLISINPLFFNSMLAYNIVTLILMMAFFYVLYLFVSEMTGRSITIREKLLLSLSIIFLYLYKMASVEEGFYWMLSTVCYHLSVILILLFFIFYNRLRNENKFNKKIFYALISCLVISLIPGTNELSAGLILILISLLIIKNFFVEKKYNWSLLLFAILAGIGVYFLLSAPGNYARSKQNLGNLDFFYSLYNSFTFFIQKALTWIFNTPLLVITLLFIPIFFKIIKNKRIREDMFSFNPIYSLIVWLIILQSSMFIVFWSTGSSPYERTINFIYFTFLIGWFYNVIVFTSYIHKKFKVNIEKLAKYIYVISFALIIFFLLRENNIKTAYIDLLGGGAYRYSNALKERYNYILQSCSDTVEVDRIYNVPKSFYSRDLIDDSSVNSDRAFARYFNKKLIVFKKSNDK